MHKMIIPKNGPQDRVPPSFNRCGDGSRARATWVNATQAKTVSGLVCALAALCASTNASGQVLNESAKLLPPDGASEDWFGRSAFGDVPDVEAIGNDDNGWTAGSAHPLQSDGSICTEEQKLTASDAAADDFLGWSVSVSGDTAIVGAIWDDCASGIDCGSAYMFRFNGIGWMEEQKLTASDAAAADNFGVSVFVSGDTAVVGASSDDCTGGRDCGSAYVFRFNGTEWVHEQKLTASDAAGNDRFGRSVSLSGNTALVGAYLDDCAAGEDCGAAYVFRFNGTEWVQEQKLSASDAARDDRFGFSVSVSGETVVVGAYLDDRPAGSECGSAYIFRFNGSSWVENQKLTALDATAGDRFGWSVSVSGDATLVGAYLNDCPAGGECGSAYVFRFDGSSWVEEQKLTASDAAASGHFGFSVSLSDDTAVVGALQDGCVAGGDCGAAYVYGLHQTTRVEEQKLTASNAAMDDGLGFSVSVSGDTVVVGALQDSCGAGADCGSAFVFSCAFAPRGACCDDTTGICAEYVTQSDCAGLGQRYGGDDSDCATMDAPCTPPPLCGNGIIETGEECEPPGLACCAAACHYEFVGAPCADDGNPCTDDVCDGAGSCEHPHDDANECDDAMFCNGVEHCESGVCLSFGDPCVEHGECNAACDEVENNCLDPEGTPCGDPSSSDCDNPDTCDGGGTCVPNYEPHGVSCDDADVCNGAESCDGSGFCVRELADDCNENDVEDVCDTEDGTSQDCNGNDIPDQCDIANNASADENNNGIPDECETVAHLDIKPGSCLNPVNPKAKGVVPVAIVGSAEFDVWQVDVDSLQLARDDGQGETIGPTAGRGPVGRIDDVTAPVDDVGVPVDAGECRCHESGADGVDDLLLRFSSVEMAAAFDLHSLAAGTSLSLTLRGALLDGTAFEATDCVVVVGTGRGRGLGIDSHKRGP